MGSPRMSPCRSMKPIALLALLSCAVSMAYTLTTTGVCSFAPRRTSSLKTSALKMTLGDDVSTNSEGKRIPPSRRNFFTQSTGAIFAGVAALSGTFEVAHADSSVADVKVGGKIQYGEESIMRAKAHGTSEFPVQKELMYGVSNSLADKICNYNRHFAEMGGYFRSTNWEQSVLEASGEPIAFYDSVTGKPLFVAPINRSAEDFVRESKVHGWPSFRDEEVVWENVRVLRSSGETVSVDGTHLGHNLPDKRGNRYCINLVSIAGKPATLA